MGTAADDCRLCAHERRELPRSSLRRGFLAVSTMATPARLTHHENSLGVGRIASISQRSRHAARPSTPRTTRRIVKQQASPTAATSTKLKTDGFNGVKVFSATMVAQRESLGGVVTAWIAGHSHFEIIDIVVTQSSDSSFHCIAISVFYREDVAPRAGIPRPA